MVAKAKSKVRKSDLCGLEGCTNLKYSRERCQTCGRDIQGRIDRGEITEEQAVAMGLLAPRRKPGRARTAGVDKAIQKLQRKGAKP